MAGMALLLLPLLLRLAPTDALAPRLVSRAHVRPAAKGWWRHAAARAKKDEDTEEEFTFDAAERYRSVLAAPRRTLAGAHPCDSASAFHDQG
eukprot:scaffold2329_cov247-Pinguiococcus_pyrenoidosus.AAC.24